MLSPVPLGTQPGKLGKPGLNFVCLTGTVNLFRFIAPPPPGSVIGNLSTSSGAVPLVQTTPLTGGPTLSSVDQHVATLCGNLTLAGNQLALDVKVVIPGAGAPFPWFNPWQFWPWGFGKGKKGFGKPPIGKGGGGKWGKGFGKPPVGKGGGGKGQKGFGKPPFGKGGGGPWGKGFGKGAQAELSDGPELT